MGSEQNTKRFGLRAQLQGYPWHDVTDEIERDGILMTVHDGLMEVQYDAIEQEASARQLAQVYLEAHSFRTGTKVTAVFNHRWERTDKNEAAHELHLTDQIHLTERLQVQVIEGQASIPATARITTQTAHDSASFTADTVLVHKALKDETLTRALGYYAQEVVDAERPLYGIFKAIEVITDHLGARGRAKLAALAGKSKKYVTDLMQSTEFTRHANTDAQVQLSDDECRQRAQLLIQSYMDSLGV